MPMPEIINGPVNFDAISETARKCIARTGEYGGRVLCIPVDVEVRGGTYIPVVNADNLRPWDTAGEFRFSLFESIGRGDIVEEVVRYNLKGDGSMWRLRAMLLGLPLNQGEANEVEPMRLHTTEPGRSRGLLRVWGADVNEQGVNAHIGWYEDVRARGVDARVSWIESPQTGQNEAVLHFIALPEEGQWKGIEGFGDTFPSADRQRVIFNSLRNPTPVLHPVGVIF